MSDAPQHTPASLRAARNAMSASRLAELAEVSRPTLRAIERGEMNVTLEHIASVAAVLGVELPVYVSAMLHVGKSAA